MNQHQEDMLRGAVHDTGTLPTDAEQAEATRPPAANQIPTGTVGAAPEERAAILPRGPGDTTTTAGTTADTRGAEPATGAARDVERELSSEESRGPASEAAH
jgi:hypothetical protein